MKMADLKAFVETKLLSKSDKALEKIGQEDSKPLGEQVVGSRRVLNVCTPLFFSILTCISLSLVVQNFNVSCNNQGTELF